SDGAPWSDNGTAKNAGLLPISENSDQFAYEVDLNGNTTGKTGAELIAQLKANGTMTYHATVKIYGMKDGKPDLTDLISTKEVNVTINVSADGRITEAMKPASSESASSMGEKATAGASVTTAMGVGSGEMSQPISSAATMTAKHSAKTLAAKNSSMSVANYEAAKKHSELPQTGETNQNASNLIGVLLLSMLTALGSVLGFRKRNLKH
ncbi:SSURE domain-containing protein, partial [Furfurilactobacillus sp. WILCCON 0119]